MFRAYKYRIYPNHDQRHLMKQHFGAMRWVYNYALERKTAHYQQTKKSLSCFDIQKEITGLKKEHKYLWLNNIGAQALQQSINNLEMAYNAFFRKSAKFPKFKSKHKSNKSFCVPQYFRIDFDKNVIKISKFKKPIKAVLHRKFTGTAKSITISKSPSGKYWASVLVDTHTPCEPKKRVERETTLGIDLGINHFAVLSDGRKIENHNTLKSNEMRLKVLQKRLSRKKKGSKNRDKARVKVARQYEKVRWIRKDFLHKLSYQLTHESQVDSVGVESLNVAGMQKNHKLAKSIGDCSWSTFLSYLAYKSDWYGKNYIEIGRFEPSSKMCSVCGSINSSLTLKDREWTCSSCQTKHDRDINAAVNIRNFAAIKGLKEQILTGQGMPVEPVETPGCKRGLRSRKSKASNKQVDA